MWQERNYFTMSHEVVKSLKDMTGSELKLYVALSHLDNRFRQKETFYRNDDMLCEITGLSKRQLCRCRARLRSMGWIKTRKRVGMATDYTVVQLSRVWRDEPAKGGTLGMTPEASHDDTHGVPDNKERIRKKGNHER